jgi:hypothetical protein
LTCAGYHNENERKRRRDDKWDCDIIERNDKGEGRLAAHCVEDKREK